MPVPAIPELREAVEKQRHRAIDRAGGNSMKVRSTGSESDGIERNPESCLGEITLCENNDLLLEVVPFIRKVFPFTEESNQRQ